MVPAEITVVEQTLTLSKTKTPLLVTMVIRTTEMTDNQELSIHPVRPVAK